MLFRSARLEDHLPARRLGNPTETPSSAQTYIGGVAHTDFGQPLQVTYGPTVAGEAATTHDPDAPWVRATG